MRVHFTDTGEEQRFFWLCLDREEVDVCLDDPGYPVDLEVTTDVRTLTEVWMGDRSFADALRHGDVSLRGPSHLRRGFAGWLGLSIFAE